MNGIVRLPEKSYDPVVKEPEILRWWNKRNIYSKTKELGKGSSRYYFLDGPPYVTNPPHVGTAWNKFLKDTIIRYKRMKGFDVHDQPGYDCHGLPIEVKVEESLDVKSKKDIERQIGVAEFISKCKSYAIKNMEKQTQIFQDLGIWMDWSNPYLTLRNTYMESVWWTIKKAYQKNLLEKGFRVVHWCSRCETALAGYEATDEYRDVKDHSIYVKMPLKNNEGRYILIWTTTPWTIPANVAVMVHPDRNYVEVQVQGETYILAEARCDPVFSEIGLSYKVVRTFKGMDLEGVEYLSPLEKEVPSQRSMKGGHRIVLSREYVSMDEGTGCVHCAPGHGEEDFEVGLEYRLPILSPIDERGKFTEKSGKYEGRYVKDADQEIIDDLNGKRLLLHHSKVVHSYPHCWRCKTPLIMRAADQWFIKVSVFKNKLLRENSKVSWTPKWAGSKRFADWLKGARDWVISRQRFWGVPLPIWICSECNSISVIGSSRELKKAMNPPDTNDLHRDCVDDITLKCRCGGVMKRIPDIVDVWMDSGVASWASLHFPDEKEFQRWWPADSITEAHDQTRGWFYTQLITGVLCFGKSPYKAVMMHGHTLDPKGQKMSKSLGNFISPIEVTAKYGRDALRLYELQNTVWEDFRFSMEKVEDAYRDIQVIWNVLSFAGLYMNLDGFQPSRWPLVEMMEKMRDEDKWLLSRTEKLKAEVTKAMEEFLIHKAARLIRGFLIEDLSHWYIRLVRRRFWLEKESLDKLVAYTVLYHALESWIKLATPFLPFLTEEAYQSIIASTLDNPVESVHMLEWPEAHLEWIDQQLIEDMETIMNVVAAAMSARQSLKLKLRQPVKEVTVFTDDKKVRSSINELRDILLEAANTKSLKCSDVKDEKRIEKIVVVPNYKILGPKFKDKASKIAKNLSKVDGRDVLDQIRDKGFYALEIKREKFHLTSDMIKFREEMPTGFARGEFDQGRVYVDSRLTDELKQEGLARDLIRRIQEMRRLMDLPVEAFIDLTISVPTKDDEKGLKGYESYIREEIRSRQLILLHQSPPKLEDIDFQKEWKIEGRSFHIGIRKVKNTRIKP